MEVRRRFVCLDQSLSNCGIAVYDEGEPLPRSWSVRLCEGVRQRASAFIEVHRLLAGIHNERAISLLGYEAPLKLRVDSVDKLIALLGLVAHVESYAAIKLIPLVSIPQTDWRETFLGDDRKGKDSAAKKTAAVGRCRQLGMDPKTHDEAEAIGLLDHLLHVERIIPPWRLERAFLPSL